MKHLKHTISAVVPVKRMVQRFVMALLLSLTAVSVLANGTVVYGIDGTGKSFDKNDRTNVYHFMMAHRAANPGSYYEYAGGVGSRPGNNFNPLNWPSKLTGAGGKIIINQMYDKLVDHFKAGRKEIVLVGFSRGAALSREFAQLIQKRGDPLKYRKGKKPKGKAPKIKFMALFDTVYSFGLAAGKHDLGFKKAITSNVQAVAHATAKWERRNTFDLWSIHFDKKYLNKTIRSSKSGKSRAEKEFCAGHDDVGGALDKNYLGYAPLKWVISEARKAGLKIATPKARLFKKATPQPDVSKEDGRCQENQVADVKGKGKRQIYFPKRGKVKAKVHKKAKNGCKGKQIYLSKGACYSCPEGFKRFSPTRKMTHPEACVKRGVGFGKTKIKGTYRWQVNGCPKNQFKHQGMCKSCPSGTKRQHIAGVDSGYCQ